MAIIFLQQKNFQKSLVVVFVFIVIITLIIIWQGVSKKQESLLIEESSLIPKKEIKIDFNKLIGQDLQNLIPFPEIEPFKEIAPSETEEGEKIPGVSIGRENPFLPY
ncbi:MAG: hypothetical protein ISS83_01465 [Candidatus Pacebacteria bacterium]|nr:hypothetical protein [Candidatus Paceibacterota bacterium]